MTETPQLSVVVPSYNHARYVLAAVHSALAQRGCEPEILVIDDASTDGSRELLEQRFKRDPRVKLVFHEQNRGVSSTFNHGLELAQGEYVGYVCSDDFWLENHLAGAVERLEKGGLAMVYSRARVVDERGRDITGEVRMFGSSPDEELFRNLVARSNFIPFVSVVMRRAVALAVGGFDTSLTTLQDFDLWLRISAAHPVGFRDEETVCFRWDANNTSGRRPENSILARVELARILERTDRDQSAVLAAQGLEDLLSERLATTYLRLSRRQQSAGERAESLRRSLARRPLRPGVVCRYLLARLRARFG